MQFIAFHNLVKSFINRKEVTEDQIDFFINSALREFQLRQSLNFTRKSASGVTYPSTAGEGVVLEVMDSQFRCLSGDYSVGITNNNGVVVPLLGDTFVNVQRRTRWNSPPQSPDWPVASIPATPISQQSIVYYTKIDAGETKLFLFPEVAAASLQVEYFAWIAEYNVSTGPTREDWLLKYGNQALLWGALIQANTFWSEEARIQINTVQYEKALDSIIRMDSTLPLEGASLSLD